MANSTIAVIPARIGSSRFARKVLYNFKGKPLIYHVWKQAVKAKMIDKVIIATDNHEIKIIAEDFGAKTFLTGKNHKTGTDRVAEVAGKTKGSIYINIQGDNLELRPNLLDRVIKEMKESSKIKCATLARRISDETELFNPNLVKLIVDKNDNALWFSRYPLPYIQQVKSGDRTKQFAYLGHIGVYFFRKKILTDFAGWKQGRFEKAESLEQLRILENGNKIKVFMTKCRPVSVDSLEDLKKLID